MPATGTVTVWPTTTAGSTLGEPDSVTVDDGQAADCHRCPLPAWVCARRSGPISDTRLESDAIGITRTGIA